MQDFNKKWMQWHTLHETVLAFEHEYWIRENKTKDSSKYYKLFYLRWEKLNKISNPSMSDCSFIELVKYYDFLSDQLIDRYDKIPEYVICIERIDKLRNQFSSEAFIESETLPYFFSEEMASDYEKAKIFYIEPKNRMKGL